MINFEGRFPPFLFLFKKSHLLNKINKIKILYYFKMEKHIYFFDISLDYFDVTEDKDLNLLPNERAVIQSIKNILYTPKYSRIFNPEFGIELRKYLFKINDYITLKEISDDIELTLRRWEDRIDYLEIVATQDEDDILIDIYFTIKNSDKKFKFSTSLRRLR